MKNPLRPYCIFFSIAGAIYLLPLINELIKGRTFVEMIVNSKVIVIFLCLCVAFIVCYLQKNIAAYWIAMLCYLTIFISRIIIKNSPPDSIAMIACAAVYLFLYAYLYPKYTIYKEFLKNNGRLAGSEELKNNELELHCKNASSDPPNPLQPIFYAAIIWAMFAAIDVFTGGGFLAKSEGKLSTYSQLITTFLISLAFVLFYWKRRKQVHRLKSWYFLSQINL